MFIILRRGSTSARVIGLFSNPSAPVSRSVRYSRFRPNPEKRAAWRFVFGGRPHERRINSAFSWSLPLGGLRERSDSCEADRQTARVTAGHFTRPYRSRDRESRVHAVETAGRPMRRWREAPCRRGTVLTARTTSPLPYLNRRQTRRSEPPERRRGMSFAFNQSRHDLGVVRATRSRTPERLERVHQQRRKGRGARCTRRTTPTSWSRPVSVRGTIRSSGRSAIFPRTRPSVSADGTWTYVVVAPLGAPRTFRALCRT